MAENEKSLTLGLLETLVAITSEPSSSAREDEIIVTVQNLSTNNLGTLDGMSPTATVAELKTAVAQLLMPLGKAPKLLLYDYAPLDDADSTLATTFAGQQEVTIQVALQILESDVDMSPVSQAPGTPVADDGGVWEAAKASALDNINHPHEGRLELPPARNNQLTKCLGPRGYKLPGTFETYDPLGAGSYGRVFRAVKKNDESVDYAIKRQPLGRFDNSSVPILRETSILHAVKGCPNIVKVFDAFLAIIEEGNPEIWSVLEYYPSDLDRLLRDFSTEQAVKAVMFQTFRGLNALHRKDIIHRDMKPSNVLVKMEPELKIAICDFGLSRSVCGLRPGSTETIGIVETDQRRYSGYSGDTAPSRQVSDPALFSLANPPLLAREISVKVATSQYRAPEMFGFADLSNMDTQGFKSLDIYSTGLIWAALFSGTHVLRHHDDYYPQEFLLLENLRKVDEPTLDRVKAAGFKPDALSFIQKVLSRDMDAISDEWARLQSPPKVQEPEAKSARADLIAAEAITIDDWIKKRRGDADAPLSAGVLGLICKSTKFCYPERPTVKDLLQDEYFQDLFNDCDDIKLNHSQELIDDVKVAMGSQLKRLDAFMDNRRDKPNKEPMSMPSLQRTTSVKQSEIDVQAICDMLRKELENR